MSDTAEEWFTKAAAADPTFAPPWISPANCICGGDRTGTEDFAQALSREPDNVVALCETAMLVAGEGKIEEGKALLAKARGIDEAYPPAHYYAGYLLGKGQLAEGLKMFEQAAVADPHNSDIYLLKAKLLEEKGAIPEAAAAYRKALELQLEPVE
jgi:tetratricopeptide (TPR) repeat protein